MSGRQTQHQGRSAGDDTTMEGRDIETDAREGVGSERVERPTEGGLEASNQAERIGELIDKDRKDSNGRENSDA